MPDRFVLKYHLRLLNWQEEGIHGWKPYVPALGTLQTMPRDSAEVLATSWLLGFKQRYRHADEVAAVVRAVAAHFACDHIFPIPPCTPERQPNSLQKIFGAPLERIAPTAARKYRHREPLAPCYGDTWRLNRGHVAGGRVLLVDDIVRTGRTMDYFRLQLAGLGLDAVPFTLGLYYRLPFVEADSISIFHEQTDLDVRIDRMMVDLDDYLSAEDVLPHGQG